MIFRIIDCVSNFYLVTIKFRESLACVKFGEWHYCKKWNVEKYKHPIMTIKFKEFVDKIISEIISYNGEEGVENRWSNRTEVEIRNNLMTWLGERNKCRQPCLCYNIAEEGYSCYIKKKKES